MRVHLCRHAEAVSGEPDELRELTGAGRYGAKLLAERLASLDEPPRNVVTSPLTRAVQTAEPVAELLNCEVLVRNELAPGATADSLRKAVDGLDGPVAAVCHQPDCSGIVLALTGHDPGFQVGDSFALELDS
jgi:phosphohistidine phosphatase SixA